MEEVFHLAIFRPFAPHDESLEPLFQRHGFRLTVYDHFDQALEIETSDPHAPKAIAVPLRLADGSSGISTCLKLRSTPEVGDLPVVGISFSPERPVIQAFYEVGADRVVVFPFEPELVRFELEALSLRLKSYREQLRTSREQSGLSKSVMTAFNLFREGLLLFNTNYELSSANSSARTMLSIGSELSERDANQIEKIFRQLLVEHVKRQAAGIGEHAESHFETHVARLSGGSFRSSVRVRSLHALDGHFFGLAAALTDLSELEQLAAVLDQAQRTRSFALLAGAASVRLLDPSHQQMIVSPINKLSEILSQEERSAPIESLLATLLEFLDVVINPSVSVKVDVREPGRVALTPPDFFQLLGHLILHAVQFAGKAGEAKVEVLPNAPGEGIPIMVSAKSTKITPPIPSDYLSRLIEGDLAPNPHNKRLDEPRIATGLRAAQTLAEKYRTTVEYRMPEPGVMKLRVKVPACYRHKGRT
ncbi:MAG: hypothetical protein KDD64_16070 [Bdellovibrionales bacterium]|nr:hypothetical protein [Bdellovibrionales bacterium]